MELGPLEQIEHLGDDPLTQRGNMGKLFFEPGIDTIARRATLQRPGRDAQGCQTQLSNRCVDLLEYLSQLGQHVAMIAQRVWHRPVFEYLEERAPLVPVVVLEAEQHKHSGACISMI